MVPDYLNDLFPRSVENPQYNVRQQNDVLTLPRRTSLFERSFVPCVIQQWKTLWPISRNIQSLGIQTWSAERYVSNKEHPLILCMGICYYSLLIPLFLIPLFSFLKSKKNYIYIYIYQFLSNTLMFVKYTKTHVFTCHVLYLP